MLTPLGSRHANRNTACENPEEIRKVLSIASLHQQTNLSPVDGGTKNANSEPLRININLTRNAGMISSMNEVPSPPGSLRVQYKNLRNI